MAGVILNAGQRHVFDSVFKQHTGALSQPTPVVTPATAFTAPGQVFGGPQAFSYQPTPSPISPKRDLRSTTSFHADPSTLAQDQVRWDRSWHVVTHQLSLNKMSHHPIIDQLKAVTNSVPAASPEVQEALKDVLSPERRLPSATHTEELLQWYSQEVRSHFLHQVLPFVMNLMGQSKPEAVLPKVIQILDRAQGLYFNGMLLVRKQMEELNPGCSQKFLEGFQKDFHAIVNKSLSDPLSQTVTDFLRQRINIILGISAQDQDEEGTQLTGGYFSNRGTEENSRRELLAFVQGLQKVGLGGEKFQVIFARVMNDAMTSYVNSTYSKVWSSRSAPSPSPKHNRFSEHSQQFRSSIVGELNANDDGPLVPRGVNHSKPSEVVKELCEWVEDRFSRVAVEVLNKLDHMQVEWSDMDKWKEMCIGRLANLRTTELFDIVVNWPNSNGALEDLRTAITTPQRRLQLTDAFSAKLSERLLHPGTSTLQILRTYISMIWSFHSLDHSKVLLDRVAYPLQVYLCSREDTVKIIITGLLAEIEDADGNPIEPGEDSLSELAVLLNKGDEVGPRSDDELDWIVDMEWVPDPVDAGPGYKRSKNADVLGTLIGVLGSPDVFIKEFQRIIGDNLLKNEISFTREVKLLELLKARFGEAPLQSCEVMMKDIQDSLRVDKAVREAKGLNPSSEEITQARRAMARNRDQTSINAEGFLRPSIHTKILSRLFWPQLHEGTYKVPSEIALLQDAYEKGFETLKNARKLKWLNTLGQAVVELELKDRVVKEEVWTWQAAVIYAFQDNDKTGDGGGAIRQCKDLAIELEMDESLVRKACQFWAEKQVLEEQGGGVFQVLESLEHQTPDRSKAAAMAREKTHISEDDDFQDGNMVMNGDMQIYWQFIQGMLKNSAAQMPLQQIAMMLKMLVADGFPYSNEQLGAFLAKKIDGGELELAGGKYKLKK